MIVFLYKIPESNSYTRGGPTAIKASPQNILLLYSFHNIIINKNLFIKPTDYLVPAYKNNDTCVHNTKNSISIIRFQLAVSRRSRPYPLFFVSLKLVKRVMSNNNRLHYCHYIFWICKNSNIGLIGCLLFY